MKEKSNTMKSYQYMRKNAWGGIWSRKSAVKKSNEFFTALFKLFLIYLAGTSVAYFATGRPIFFISSIAIFAISTAPS